MGRLASLLVLLMVAAATLVLVLRFVFDLGWAALQEAYVWLHASVFLIAAGAALRSDKHVRIELLSQRLSARGRASIELIGGTLLLAPMLAAIGWSVWPLILRSFAVFEASPEAGGLPGLFLLKSLVLVFCGGLAIEAGLARASCLAAVAWGRGSLLNSGEWLAIAMLPVACLVLLSGYPVAFVLGGLAIAFAVLGSAIGVFDPAVLGGLGLRLFGLMTNPTLAAVPLFIFMGMMLERSGLARDLLLTMAGLAGRRPGGLGIAVVATGGLMAATTGVAGATIVTTGLIALPVMIEAGYDRRLAAGSVAAAGTLGQLIPPSIALLILADVISAAHQETQLRLGDFAPEPVAVVDLFAGALVPGLLLLMLYFDLALCARPLRTWTHAAGARSK